MVKLDFEYTMDQITYSKSLLTIIFIGLILMPIHIFNVKPVNFVMNCLKLK